MQGKVHYGEHVIPYEVRIQPGRAVRKVSIHVEPDGRVVVDAPEGASKEQLRQAINARVRWVHGHVTAAKERLRHVLPREYVSGETLLYLGRRYRLKVSLDVAHPMRVRMRGAFIEVSTPESNPFLVRESLQAWYRNRAKEVLKERVCVMAANLRWITMEPALRLLSMRSQWGSCSPAGRLTLNPQLIKAPRECIDYVVLHELCHLKEHNHSKRFYSLLDKHMPGWTATKLRLDSLADVLLNE